MDVYEFPKSRLPEKEKNAQYHADWGKAIYSYDKLGTNTFINSSLRDKFIELEKYGAGNQDPEKYRDLYSTMNEETRERKGYSNINEEIFGYATKLKNGVIKLLTGNGNKIDVIFSSADIDRKRKMDKARLMAETMFKPQIEALNQMSGAQPAPKKDFEPKNKEELEAYEQAGGFKLNEELALEVGVDANLEVINNWEMDFGFDIKEKFIDIGVAGVVVDVDNVTKTIKYRLIDPKNLIIDNSSYVDFRDSEFMGEIRSITINDILLAFKAEGRELTEDEANQLAESSQTSQYTTAYTKDVSWYDVPKEGGKLDNSTNTVTILDFVFKSIDIIETPLKARDKEVEVNKDKVSEKELKNGKIYEREGRFYKKVKNTKNTIDVPVWRRGKLVLGTDIVYDYGLVYNHVRNQNDEPVQPFIVQRLRVKPIMEVIKPNLDALQMCMLKIQMFNASAAPAGIAINVDALQNIVINGDTFDPKKILQLRKMNGTYLYKMRAAGTPHTYNGNQGVPFQETEGGIGRALNEQLMLIDFNIRMMQDNTGLSDIALAQAPQSEMGLGLNQMSLDSSKNIISNIYYAYKNIKERVASITALHLLQLAKNEPDHTLYIETIGETYWKKLGEKEVSSIKSIGATLRDMPQNEELQFMYQLIQQSLQIGRNGQPALTPDEAYLLIDMIKDGKPLKYVNLVMRKFRERREEQSRMENEKNIQMQGQQNQQSQQIAAQGAIEAQMQKLQGEIQKLREEYDLKLRNDMQVENLKLKGKQIEIGMKAEMDTSRSILDNYMNREKSLNS